MSSPDLRRDTRIWLCLSKCPDPRESQGEEMVHETLIGATRQIGFEARRKTCGIRGLPSVENEGDREKPSPRRGATSPGEASWPECSALVAAKPGLVPSLRPGGGPRPEVHGRDGKSFVVLRGEMSFSTARLCAYSAMSDSVPLKQLS